MNNDVSFTDEDLTIILKALYDSKWLQERLPEHHQNSQHLDDVDFLIERIEENLEIRIY